MFAIKTENKGFLANLGANLDSSFKNTTMFFNTIFKFNFAYLKHILGLHLMLKNTTK